MPHNVAVVWESHSDYVRMCRVPAFPSQHSDDERATCVGMLIRDPLIPDQWIGYAATTLVATGTLSVVQKAVEIEVRILCSAGGGGAMPDVA